LRSLSPRVVIFDEIIDKLDWLLAEKAIFSGVNIIGTIHANNLNDLLNKSYFKKNVFNRYVFIKNCNSPGQIQEILDGDFKIL
ncbi:MAG: stage III sporulation protein AA, partial [Clostridia bacterium]|nr:stage III sporulation protein AA [Clostridia bacterium]